MDFFQTQMGRQFYEGTMRTIARNLEKIAEADSAKAVFVIQDDATGSVEPECYPTMDKAKEHLSEGKTIQVLALTR